MSSPQPRLHSEALPDFSLLNIPSLQSQRQQQESAQQPGQQRGHYLEESRNDCDNGGKSAPMTVGRAGYADSQAQNQPCFKQDRSMHRLPTHPLSLKPIQGPRPSGGTSPRFLPSVFTETGGDSGDGSEDSLEAMAGGTASVGAAANGLTVNATVSTRRNSASDVPAERHQHERHRRSLSTTTLAEKAEQIIEEARLQASLSVSTSKWTEDILREARLASSRNLNGSDRSLCSSNGSNRSLTNLSGSNLDETRRREIIQEALRARSAMPKSGGGGISSILHRGSSTNAPVIAAVAATPNRDVADAFISKGTAQERSPSRTTTDATTPLPDAAPTATLSPSPAIRISTPPSRKAKPTDMVSNRANVVTAPETTSSGGTVGLTPTAATLVSRVALNDGFPDKDDSDDSGQHFHRTRSAEEVLDLANLLLDEVHAEVNRFPRDPVPMSPSYSAIHEGGSQNHHPQILSPINGESPATPSRGFVEGQEFDITSPTDSDVASIEDFEYAVSKLPSRLKDSNPNGDPIPRETILRKLDGMQASPVVTRSVSMKSCQSDLSTRFEDGSNSMLSSSGVDDRECQKGPIAGSNSFGTKRSLAMPNIGMKRVPVKPVVIKSLEVKQQPEEINPIESWLTYFLGPTSKDVDLNDQESDDNVFPVSCVSPQLAFYEDLPTIASSMVRVADEPLPPSFAQVVASNNRKEEARLQDWVQNKFMVREDLPRNGSYLLGESKTIVVHEILRGDWTWCTAWSPDGSRLAIATENHHLAVVDTTSSSVWRVRHDRRSAGPPKQGTTHSIRSIAWGENFIAIGGTGNAVSILATSEPYPILHTVTPTGFVGSMHWLPGTNKLLVGSRLGKAILLDIWTADDISSTACTQGVREIQSTVLYMVDRERAWVNAVQFSPRGSAFAVGDSKGILGIYSFKCEFGREVEITNITNFMVEDSIMDIEWSSDGQYLYAGGEDFAVTVISTKHWEPVHRIKRDRWIQFIASSQGASHIAVGGVTSEVSILDVNNGWDNVINVSLKGLVPLSAKWHPQDQYLVLTGQNNSILAIETTNARHISGHFLRSVHPILSIAFSPDGRMAAIGNEMGVVTIFRLSSTTFLSVYEMVVDCTGSLSIEWSHNGAYLVIAAGNKVVVVARTETLPGSAPPNASGFFVAKVIRDLGTVYDVSIDPTSRFVAASGAKTRVLDATSSFKNVVEMENGGTTLANSWSPDGKWFAAIGKDHSLVIYDTSPMNLSLWQSVFTVTTNQAGLALAWGPSSIGGLQYCAYGGEDMQIYIVEIRTKERTWETVLTIPREGVINDLDWNDDGLVAAAVGNGTVSVLDLSYLQSGWAVNEMDYNWQRQALTCFTEIRRNRGKHIMKAVRWVPSAPGSDNLLAVGGTDGELEIIDLTARNRCRGFEKVKAFL